MHVKKRLRDAALDRMKLEREQVRFDGLLSSICLSINQGNAATIEDNCSICLEPHAEEAVITAPCAHMFCKGEPQHWKYTPAY